MIRLVVYILVSLGLALGAAWLIALPGTVSVEVAGYRMQPGLGLSAAALIVVIVLSILLWAIIRRLLEAPGKLARLQKNRRQKTGVHALSEGFVALEAGDASLARTLAREARGKLEDNSAAHLLEARAELALGNMSAARDQYRGLIANPKTALAALAGLHEQARRQGRDQAALTFAQKAAKIAPRLEWAQDAVLDDLVRQRDWAGATELVKSQPTEKWRAREANKRIQAVLQTAMACDTEQSDPDAALASGMSALKLLPDFVPAGLIVARIHINRGETRKAQSLLRRLWRAGAHPHVATLFAHSISGASAVDRLKRLRQLVDMPVYSQAEAMVLARAAIDAYEWSLARNALANYSSVNPSQGVCSLMAEIEEGQNGDQGKARAWLGRAVKAPRDAAWIADGIVSDEWEPVSPVTGKLDAFEWSVPQPVRNRVAGPSETAQIGHDSADEEPNVKPEAAEGSKTPDMIQRAPDSAPIGALGDGHVPPPPDVPAPKA